MSSSTPPPSASEPIAATPISSAPPPFIPIQLNPSKDSAKNTEGTSANPEETVGTEQMEQKAEEAAAKKSKARACNSESKGKRWPCTTKEIELRNLEAEGFLQPGSWRTTPGDLAPAPEAGEWVVTKALIERGFSMPPSDFFTEILQAYQLQPHNISPNSILAISNHVTLCEGHLRVTPDLQLFQRICKLTEEGLSGKDLTMSWFTKRIQPLQHRDRLMFHYTGRDDLMRASKDNLSADALDKRIWVLIKVPRDLHVHECNVDNHMNGSGTALEALEEKDLGTLTRNPHAGTTEPEAASDTEAPKALAPAKRKRAAPAGPASKHARETPSAAATRRAEKEKQRLKQIDTSKQSSPILTSSS
ncbi:hypothetical protein QYE76_065779 [Lolium multiflorum]|uniref:Transposase (putative) gypsy type domain-containing protein n=1 Tax=Lolium multiflorum TaxID=4521 RepID=A0AAD8WBC6_LOLMU|nr:hypothetical protein QYE76_065779 [Lolium multiflorum]